MSKMNAIANEVKDLAYDNDLQAGVIASDENGQPLAVIIGNPDVLEEVASVLKADHNKTVSPAPEEEPRVNFPVPAQKKPGFFARLLGL